MNIRFGLIAGCLCLLSVSAPGTAQVLPGPADIDRVKPQPQDMIPVPQPEQKLHVPSTLLPDVKIPPEAKEIHFDLKDVHFAGVTAFNEEELRALYAPYLNTNVSLEIAWVLAGKLTEKYREEGYFLSRAYVPAQEIGDGIITIKAVEGFIGSVFENEGGATEQAKERMRGSKAVIEDMATALKAQKPLKIEQLEHELLLLNDLPGLTFQATLEPSKTGAEEGAVRLILTPQAKEWRATITEDNFGSRYLGPYQTSVNWQGSLLPLQQTQISGLITTPLDNLKSLNLVHSITVMPETTIEISAGRTLAMPGYKLKISEVKSDSTDLGLGVNYQLIRQRQENLRLKFELNTLNSDSNILGTPLNRDRVRVVRASANYDRSDPWAGYNYMSATLSQGIKLFGANSAGELNISRAGAKPDFTKFDLSYTRFQSISPDWFGVFSFAGQKASGSLYSSEEIGYGGQLFGRAYDTSEISGDDGVDASLELRYQGLNKWSELLVVPYGFYDIGKVWNDNIGQVDEISGASAGLGLRFRHDTGFNGNIFAAQPLTKTIGTPLYGENGKNPRFGFQLQYDF